MCTGNEPLAQFADRVILEMTERSSLHEVTDVRTKVARLRELGFRIAVDDLGAGYAGLSTLPLLEPEIVKFDMSLIRDIHQAPTKARLVGSMTTLCRELGVQTVAEGIETVDENRQVVELGCDLLQGFFLGRPAPDLLGDGATGRAVSGAALPSCGPARIREYHVEIGGIPYGYSELRVLCLRPWELQSSYREENSNMASELEHRTRESVPKRTILPLTAGAQAAAGIRPKGRTRLALVGFGEIGVATAIACAQDSHNGVEVVQIFNRRLSARDAWARTVHSRFVDPTDVSCWVEEGQGYLRILDQVSKVPPHDSLEDAASRLDDVDVVVFSVGRYAQDRACLQAFLRKGRAKAVVVTCASRAADFTMVAGFNHDTVNPLQHRIVALGSCTGNCAVPILSVVEDLFGVGAIRGIYSVAPHSKTNSQQIGTKGMDPKKEGLLGNLIPTSTGLTKLLQQPGFFSVLGDSVDAVSVRTPTEDVSLLCMAMDVEGADEASTADVRAAFRNASEGTRWRGIMGFGEARGSKVFWKDRHACVVYEPYVKLMPKFLKNGRRAPLSTLSVMAAYANVYGYSCQIVRSVQALKLGRASEAAERLRQPALAG